MEELDVSYLKPLEDRIYEAVGNLPQFTKREVAHFFPNETDRVLYGALQKMEKQKRIRYIGRSARNKVYTVIGQSQLPSLKGLEGNYFPVSTMLTHVAGNYEDYSGPLWQALEPLNELPVAIARLFFVLDAGGEKEQKQAYFNRITALSELRQRLTVMVGYIDSIVKHPTMSGDLDYFRQIYGGKDAALPTQEQIAEFKLWYSRNFGLRSN